jgi:predicted nucleic acid-binding protein
MYVIDTYSWLDYFSSTKKNEELSKLIEQSPDLHTPALAFSEVKRMLLRKIRLGEETRAGMAQKLHFIRLNSFIAELDADTAERAAEIADELGQERKGMGLADAVILATARSLGAKVVTGDEHFRGLKDVVFIKP